MNWPTRYRTICAALLLLTLGTGMMADRGGGGGNRGATRSNARTSVNRDTNVNRNNVNRNNNVSRNANVNTNVHRNANVNVNRNVDVHRDVDVDVHGGYYGRGGCCYHPVATAAAVTAASVATAAVVGSMVNTLPPACSAVVVNGLTYQQCGSTWYQPQFMGSNTTYVVVNSPR